MRTNVVLTLTGPDRVGIVEEVTRVLLGLDGNVETSRMARLGGEFAILMLVSLPQENVGEVGLAFEDLTAEGYALTTRLTQPPQMETPPGWTPYRVEVEGADHEGIIHEIADGLSQRGINIESMETGTKRAPVSGSPLFTMRALVVVPPGLADTDWIAALTEAGERSMVDITVTAADGT